MRISTTGSQVLINRASRLLGQFELYWMTCLLLSNDGPLKSVAVRCNILQAQSDDIAPAELAINRQVKKSKVAQPFLHLELSPNGPNNPEATAAAFSSGDLVSTDSAGNVTLTGRLKDLINRGGVKYNPLEVEPLIESLPAFLQCAIMPNPHAFHLHVPDETLREIRDRVANFPWHEMPDDGGWAYGTNLDYMKELSDYWVTTFDWRKQEAAINRFSNFTAPIDGIDIHFIHEKGSGPAPLPLIISHGWPGSVVEFLEIIEPLAHPERFGGDPEDAFDVIAPSLPGFGFSGRPPRPIGPRKVASLFATLMSDVLGYDGYLAQGGDWGGGISGWLGFDAAPACKAVHLNIMQVRHPDGPQTQEERDWAERFPQEQELEEGYRIQQGTKPQTLSYAMMDSPVGIAAWLVEKFNSWSDTDGDDIESAHSKDTLLTNIMVYIVTRTFNTASWIYYGRREEGGRVMNTDGRRVEVPTACALFPKELLRWPPRSYVERMFNVQRWTEMPKGGHFAAMEQPDLLIDDIRAFARSIR